MSTQPLLVNHDTLVREGLPSSSRPGHVTVATGRNDHRFEQVNGGWVHQSTRGIGGTAEVGVLVTNEGLIELLNETVTR